MNNKKVIVIPAIFSFANILKPLDRNITAGVFIPNKSINPNLVLLESLLFQITFIDILGRFTNDIASDLGKLFKLGKKSELDMIICYSLTDLSNYEHHLKSTEYSVLHWNIPIYCIEDCILIKGSKHIQLL